MVDFGGWALPTQYDSILKEHAHVREAAGLFDVSHMGEIAVTGAGAKEFVHSILTNDVLQAQNGQAVYGILCYENGCAVDDLIAYIQSDSKILLVVNAANDDKDFAYIQSLCPPGIELEHASARLGQLALQGPKAQKALSISWMERQLRAFPAALAARDIPEKMALNCIAPGTTPLPSGALCCRWKA